MTVCRAACSAGLLAILLSIGCAHHAAAPEASTRESSEQTELASLEKKIAERKRELPSGSPLQSESKSVPMSSGDAGSSPRCDGVCQAAEEICTCSRRICKLALDIADEPSANSCRRSQKDCEEAGKSCASCR